MKFFVLVREVHVSYMLVEADTKESALAKVADGEGERRMMEYSHTLDKETWTVEKMQPEGSEEEEEEEEV